MSKRKINVTVCIPVYNGDRFIEEQIKSIQDQLIDGDEMLIADDCSTDKSIEAISMLNDKRIKVIKRASNLGVNKNVSDLLLRARMDYIFLADQDDLWIPGRLDLMIERLENGRKGLAVGNASCVDSQSRKLAQRFYDVSQRDSSSSFKNIIKIILGRIAYNGCCMVMTKDFRDHVCPIPSFVESHDLWFALVANARKSLEHIDEDVTFRRIHSENLSLRRRSTLKKLKSRIIMARMVLGLIKIV